MGQSSVTARSRNSHTVIDPSSLWTLLLPPFSPWALSPCMLASTTDGVLKAGNIATDSLDFDILMVLLAERKESFQSAPDRKIPRKEGVEQQT